LQKSVKKATQLFSDPLGLDRPQILSLEVVPLKGAGHDYRIAAVLLGTQYGFPRSRFGLAWDPSSSKPAAQAREYGPPSSRCQSAIGRPIVIAEVAKTFILLIERYDRFSGADGHVHRIHQEDFCQALGRPPEKKYACDGGPPFADCFNLLRTCSTVPALDVIALLDAAIFNVVVGNADAHGKNFSILYRGGAPRLAPLYDLLCTTSYRSLSKSFAMKLGKRKTLGELDAKGWGKFALDAGMSWPFVRQRVRHIVGLVQAKIKSVVAEFASLDLDQAVVGDLAVLIRERAAACETTLTK
jgi:serine/threonine-protein kinase HipA